MRFLSREGRSNLVSYGLRRHFYTDVYHSWLRAPWSIALGAVTALYLAVNCLFAAAYLLVGGVEHLGPRSYADAFFFSVKFARPTARVLWSEVAVVAPFEGVPSLLFRVANQRGNLVVEAQIRVILLISEKTSEGMDLRRQIDLHLRRSVSTVFALSWTVVHPLTPDSPFVTRTREQLLAGRAEIVASLTGLDDAFSQTIHSRHSWAMDEIAWNARFVDIMGTLPDGRQGVDYRRFHEVVPLERPDPGSAP